MELITYYKKPEKIYKYQCFYDEKNVLNEYWKTNITGKTFRLNVASSFEDANDSKPIYNVNDVIGYLKSFFLKFFPDKMEERISELKKEITDESFQRIVSNYQNNIYIGCFTGSSDNQKMWEKYSNNHSGYCIEYELSKNELLLHDMLPVIYQEGGFDISFAFFVALFLENVEKGKTRTLEENIKIYEPFYKRMIKMTQTPIFIKGKEWEFEREYRLFLLKHFHNGKKMVKADAKYIIRM
ncbi:MAG: DUF2971 domain-containing protein [Lachnospiraceae bacterium]|nr:DUF2971 domain-containing protein [Lachnospiraceae bacterium]